MTSWRAIVVDDTDSRIHYTGSGWFQGYGIQDSVGNFGPAYQSTLHGTKSDGSLSFSFQGTKVVVFGSNNIRNDSGVLDPTWECYVDNISIGKTTPFQFPENNWIFCDQDGLLDGPHILTVKATVKKQQTFWFDYIQYIPSSSVSLDNTVIKVDNPDSDLQYGSGWNDLGTTANFTQTPNAIFTYSFVGVSLSWYSFVPEEFSHAATSGSNFVDNQAPIPFSLNGFPGAGVTVYNQLLFKTPEFSLGPHTIVVTYHGNASTTPLTLDYLVVQNGTFASLSSPSSSPTTTGNNVTGNDTTGTNTNDPVESNHSSHSSNVGAIAGGVVGGVVGGIVLIILVTLSRFYFHRWDRKQSTIPLYEDIGHDSPYIKVLNSNGQWCCAPGGNPPPTGNSRDTPSSDSREDDMGHLPTAENEVHARCSYPQSIQSPPPYQLLPDHERREAEATPAALPLQQQIVSQPQNTSSVIRSSQMIVHEDSGVRLSFPTSDGVVEAPPTYSEV